MARKTTISGTNSLQPAVDPCDDLEHGEAGSVTGQRSNGRLPLAPKLLLVVLVFLVLLTVWLATARERFDAGLKSATLTDLQSLTAAQPNNPQVFYYLGLKASQSGEHELAMRSLAHAARLSPDDYATWRAWAIENAQDIGFAGARDVMVLYVTAHPNSGPANLDLARLYAHVQMDSEAYRTAQVASGILQKSPDAWQIMGQSALDVKRYKDSQAAFEAAVRIAPNDWHNWDDLGEAFEDDHQSAKARVQFEHALKLAPTNPTVQLHLGEAMVDSASALSDYDAAREVLQNAAGSGMLSESDLYYVSIYLGQTYLHQRRPKEALPYLQVAARIGPLEPMAHFYLYQAFRLTGNAAAATTEEKLHQDLLKVDNTIKDLYLHVFSYPNDVHARVLLGNAYGRRGHFLDADKQYRAVLQLDPSNKTALVALKSLEKAHPDIAQQAAVLAPQS